MYKGDETLEAVIDRAYGLSRILAEEDAEGPYLLIDFAEGDYYSHEAEGQCTLRLRGGELVVEGNEF